MPTCSPSSPPAAGCAPTCCARRGTCSPRRTCAGCSGSPGPASRAGCAGVNRRLGLTAEVVTAALRVLESLLAGPTPRTRREVRVAFDAAGPANGRAAPGAPADHRRGARRHLLGPAARDGAHLRARRRGGAARAVRRRSPSDDARRELTRRFISGHGPASERDLARWSTLTLTQIRSALADLAGVLERVEVDGHELWFDPPGAGAHHARSRRLPAADLRRGRA